jgi:hypothetical protein
MEVALSLSALATFHSPSSGEEPATQMLSPDCAAYVVLKVTPTMQDGFAEVLEVVLDFADELRCVLEDADGVGSGVGEVSLSTTSIVVVYVVTLALIDTTEVKMLVNVSVTVSFVPVQSIGTYGVGVNVAG